jgi:hypothetical protein
MLRIASTSILILAGGAVTATLLCLLALRVLCAVIFALSGVRRQEQVLNW